MAAKSAPDTGYRLWERADRSRIWSVARPETDARPVTFSALSRELGGLLLEPLRPHLARKSRVLISPDGLLAAVPFELLLLDETSLGDRHAVHYAQSLSVYARILQRAKIAPKSERRSILAIGAPTFGTAPPGVADGFSDASARYRTAGLEWKPLPGAHKEIESVARHFSGARIFVGDRASEENLQELDTAGERARFRYIHFATHAYFSGDSPDLSAIVLRQPGNDRADGYLTVAELPRYRLDSDLVVLSACETATGRSVDGEGMMGFAYALLIAGNRGTVAALWKVPDEATALFMQKFFAGVRRGESHAVALARAKRDLQREPRFSAPLNWAGFVLYGV
jgi:CHAT domain-containing protein